MSVVGAVMVLYPGILSASEASEQGADLDPRMVMIDDTRLSIAVQFLLNDRSA